MTIAIRFSKTSSEWEENNFNFNLLMVKTNINHMDDIIKVRGYLYINDIYEYFGIKWDPNKNVNYCITQVGKISYRPEEENEFIDIIVKDIS